MAAIIPILQIWKLLIKHFSRSHNQQVLKHVGPMFFQGVVVWFKRWVGVWEELPCTQPHFMWRKGELDMVSSDPEVSEDNSRGV